MLEHLTNAERAFVTAPPLDLTEQQRIDASWTPTDR